MAHIILPHRWSRQPAYLPAVDWGNSLSQALRIAVLPGDPSGSNLAYGYSFPTTTNTALRGANAPGRVANGDAAGFLRFPTDFGLHGATQFTVFSLALAGTADYAPHTMLSIGVDFDSSWYFHQYPVGNSLYGIFVRLYGGSGSGFNTVVTTTRGHSWNIHAARIDSGVTNGSTYFFNGISAGNFTITPGTGGGSLYCAIGGKPGVSFGVGAANALVFAWKRLVSDAEIAELTRNPWQLFRPLARRIYIPSTAAGGGDVQVDLSGVSATAATGSLSITGAAGISLSGVSATAAVGDVTVSVGTNVSVDVSGVSATAATGSLAVTGDANVSITGNELISSVGSITVTGAANVTLDGVSATASVGTVLVDVGGHVTVNAEGVSATASVGTVTVTGDATVELSGLSAAGSVGNVSFGPDVSSPTVEVAAGGSSLRRRTINEYVIRVDEKDYYFGSMEEALTFLNAQRDRIKDRVEEAAEKAARRIIRAKGKAKPPKRPRVVEFRNVPKAEIEPLRQAIAKIDRDFDNALADVLAREAEVKDIIDIIGML